MIPVASVAGNALSYEDKDVSIGSKYTYIVRPISTENVCPAEYTDPIIFAGLVKWFLMKRYQTDDRSVWYIKCSYA